MTPFEMDDAITRAAHSLGIYDCFRVPVLEIDERQLPDKYFRRSPDRRSIRRALADGVEIPGVKVTNDVEYFLRRKGEDA